MLEDRHYSKCKKCFPSEQDQGDPADSEGDSAAAESSGDSSSSESSN